MRRTHAKAAATATLLIALLAPCAHATDTDGPDCERAIEDWGDAPEGPTDFPIEGVAAYPTCITPGPIGSRQFVTTPLGTAPGPAGFVRHLQSGISNYWIGCNDEAGGLSGVDSETNGKASPGIGVPGCGSGPLPDCDHFGMGQDECETGTDAGAGGVLFACARTLGSLFITTGSCGEPRSVYLNVLADLNNDGDWNDNFPCRDSSSPYCVGPCTSLDGYAHEWAVKNVEISLPTGCSTQELPSIEPGPYFISPAIWVRVTLTDGPVGDDFPWAGGTFAGGETEDHLITVTTPDRARPGTWGELKIRYR